nr:hypothetical protein [Mycobacterium sp. E3298]
MQTWEQLSKNKVFYTASEIETTDDDNNEVVISKHQKMNLVYVESNEVLLTVEGGLYDGFELYYYTNREKPEDLLTESEFAELQDKAFWKDEFKKVKQCTQRQDSLNEQMSDLYTIANKFGFYDAADFIKEKFVGR